MPLLRAGVHEQPQPDQLAHSAIEEGVDLRLRHRIGEVVPGEEQPHDLGGAGPEEHIEHLLGSRIAVVGVQQQLVDDPGEPDGAGSVGIAGRLVEERC